MKAILVGELRPKAWLWFSPIDPKLPNTNSPSNPAGCPGSLKNLLVFRKILSYLSVCWSICFILRLCVWLLKIHSKRWKILRAICGGGGGESVRIEKEIKLGWVTLRDNSRVSSGVSAECFVRLRNIGGGKNIFVAWGFAFSSSTIDFRFVKFSRHATAWA